MGDRARIAIVVSHPIQHFCPQYASFAAHGGAEVRVFFGSAVGHRKYFDPDFGTEVSWGNLRLDRFDHTFLNGDAPLPLNRELDAASLDEKLAEFSPHLVICYGHLHKLQRRAGRWAVRNGRRLAYIADSERRQRRSLAREVIKVPFLRWYFARVNYFLTVGDANEQYYESYGVPRSKMIRMHFPIDREHYADCFSRRDELRREVRRRHGIPPEAVVLSAVGKLIACKRQGDVIDALLRLEGADETYCAFIIGAGERLGELQAKAAALRKNRAIFMGFVNAEDLPAYYAATDVYVHASSTEPHSLAISEAIFMGCPVVLSDRCGSYGPSDDVQEGLNGFVFECGNTADLAEKIRRLGADAGLREEFGRFSHGLGESFQARAHRRVLDALVRELQARPDSTALGG
jgi:glycosyltransferase involved in cell wall biosynthesis